MIWRQSLSSLFPYTTLFRSLLGRRAQHVRLIRAHPQHLDVVVLARVGERLDRVEHEVPEREAEVPDEQLASPLDRKSTRLNSSHMSISYAVFCLKNKILNLI